MQKFHKGARSNWSFYGDHIPKDKRALMNITSYMDANVTESATLRVCWEGELITRKVTHKGSVVTLPECYTLVKTGIDDKRQWIAVSLKEVPAETSLQQVDFSNWDKRTTVAYTTPEEKLVAGRLLDR